jgi:hypothetical protein
MQDMLKQATLAKTASVVLLSEAAHMGLLEEPLKVGEGIRAFTEFCFNN